MNAGPFADQPLAEIALERLASKLAAQGSPLSNRASCAIGFLMVACEKALEGQLPPAYHLASIDPGQGKSLAVAEFLKLWWERGCPGKGGVLIGVSRLSEIRTYIEAMGLPSDQFGVLTSSPELNAAGVRTSDLDTVPILFTTQQMIHSRTKGRTFRDTTDFHFRGRPRSLRIWDESLIPAAPLVVGRDELGGLLQLRLHHPDYVEAVDALMAAIDDQDEGAPVKVPLALAGGLGAVGSNIGKTLPDDVAKLVETLRRLADREGLVVTDGAMGRALVAADDGLPSDFPPVIILDASGRARTTYGIWARHRHDLVRMPSAVSDYSRLRVWLWQRTSGKTAMRGDVVQDDIIRGLAEAINEVGDGDWLVIHYKQDEDFGADLKAQVVNRPERIRCTHWGNHHGTNDYRDVPNVALVGMPTYRLSGYMALALACGVPPTELAATLAEIRDGERAHHYLQAACRGAVRKVVDGVAGSMRLFLVASPSGRLKGHLRGIFPGCSISDWNAQAPLKGKAKLAADYLLSRFSDPSTMRVRKAEVRKAVNIERTSTFASHVMRQPSFRYFLNANWLDEQGQYFERVEPFDEGDGYVYSPETT